jgi:hypothetical protein
METNLSPNLCQAMAGIATGAVTEIGNVTGALLLSKAGALADVNLWLVSSMKMAACFQYFGLDHLGQLMAPASYGTRLAPERGKVAFWGVGDAWLTIVAPLL